MNATGLRNLQYIKSMHTEVSQVFIRDNF